MYVNVCVCVQVHVCMHMCAHVCECQRSTSDIVLKIILHVNF